jgi:hypothetical protein
MPPAALASLVLEVVASVWKAALPPSAARAYPPASAPWPTMAKNDTSQTAASSSLTVVAAWRRSTTSAAGSSAEMPCSVGGAWLQEPRWSLLSRAPPGGVRGVPSVRGVSVEASEVFLRLGVAWLSCSRPALY